MAGTPVVMADGSVKPIEQVKAGDQVLAKSESTGEVSAKKVTQTFQRQAPSTWALSFSGEVIETTAEHPFYVEHKGFVPAGLLAVGNSIVTRAGPALQVLGNTEKKQAAQVYNFSVQDNHTYFVGKSGLWVHNVDCTIADALLDAAEREADKFIGLTSRQRPGATVAIHVPGSGAPIVGRSKKGLSDAEWNDIMDSRVQKMYDDLPQHIKDKEGHTPGSCAEAAALSEIFRRGLQGNLQGASSLAVKVGGDSHGRIKVACAHCTEVLKQLRITDLFQNLKVYD